MKTTYLPPAVYRAIEHERTKEERTPFTVTVTELLCEALTARGLNLEDFEPEPELHG